jgi:TAG lipase / steryl ester hydrolase / phospholipase A2 / LPA acyltransferase
MKSTDTPHDRSGWLDLASRIDTAAAAEDRTTISVIIQGALDRITEASDPSSLRAMTGAERDAVRLFADAVADAIPLLDRETISMVASAVGETALMLSGGGKLGNYHIGVIRVLHDGGLLPRVISGASAGSIMAAMVGSRTDAELRSMLSDGARNLISDTVSGELDYDMTTLQQDKVKTLIARVVPDLTFAEARAISGRDINISVARARAGEPGRVLSAQASPDVLLRDAVLASCAVPMIYAPVVIRQRSKDGRISAIANGAKWVDGSVYADMPARLLRGEFGVTRTVASVVNPLELPFLTDPDAHGALVHSWATTMNDAMRSAGSIWLSAMLPFTRRVPLAGHLMAMWQQVIDQRIEADVIIAPGTRFFDPTTLLQQASAEQMIDFITEGDAAVTARLPLIAPALTLEAALRSSNRNAKAEPKAPARVKATAGASR